MPDADPSPPRSAARRMARVAVWPARRFFDPRFATVTGALEHQTKLLEAAVTRQNEVLLFLRQDLARLADEVGSIRARLGPDPERRLVVTAAGLEAMDETVADFLNYVNSHRGPLAERNLWFNDPLSMRYSEGDVTLDHVNERVVEVPFVFRSLADLPNDARILDVGACESGVAFSLASLGYHVTAVDLRKYPLEHPNLTTLQTRLEDAGFDAESFDAVICLSSIEHFGLESYGSATRADDSDVEAISLIRRLLKPGGKLVLTVPFGVAAVDEFQRTYDEPALDRLVADFRVSSRLILEQRTATEWSQVGERLDTPKSGCRYVALVVGTAPPEA